MEECTPTISHGSALLNSGRTLEALVCFLEVRDEYRQTNEGSSSAEIEQLLGICYRLLGRLIAAEHCFRVAFALTEDHVHRARILRDWAMVAMARHDYERTNELLNESAHLLERRNEPLEYAATMGFLARVYARHGDTESARMHYQMADLMLQSGAHHDPARAATYELNNLVWWLKVASGPRRRLQLARRAWRLATITGNRKRQVQIVSLVIGRPLSIRLFDR